MTKDYDPLDKQTTTFSPIDNALEVKATDVVKQSKKVKKVDGTPRDDFEYSRAQLYNIVEKGQEAMDGILDVCQDTQHPRAYEVAGQLVKAVGDVTDKIIDLQRKMKDLEKEDKPTQVTNNSLFVGSTADLQKMIKKGLAGAPVPKTKPPSVDLRNLDIDRTP
tara:strand:+ start:6565 stop:7053 length:489 start_codon:yes stop_codon:yes gene_type:complete